MTCKLIPAALFAAMTTVLSAQTQTVRGDVEDVPNTANQFVLKCTGIPLVSTTLNLNNLLNSNWILDVVNVGTTASPVLDVRAATLTTKVFDMGNLRLNRADRWQVSAAPGSFAFVLVDLTTSTRYTPLGQIGTWLLSGGAGVVASGTTNAAGVFETSVFVPNLPALVGTSFSGQALVATGANLLLSNADCRQVRAN